MTDAPEKVWVHYEPETDDAIWAEYPDMDGLDEFNHYGEYTRSDIAQARIDNLHHSLGQLMQVQEGVPMTGIEATRRLKQAHAALKGSDT